MCCSSHESWQIQFINPFLLRWYMYLSLQLAIAVSYDDVEFKNYDIAYHAVCVSIGVGRY